MDYPWLHNGHIITSPIENSLGFVYCITHKESGKKYIGKKTFWNRARKRVNGKSKRVLVESDWKEYWGSSKALLEFIKTQGEEHFLREILHVCKSKGEMNWLELKEQVERNALLSEDYYNEFIGAKIHRKHLPK